ncbi:MAG: D-glycero-beta-D-manno-heptose-7-phosphate kinase, partial [Sulfuritalea sp.]|nr:D-glycero-beta-D-manno-heptose-7-phosphate kinase [Sulfuritalea sp.]
MVPDTSSTRILVVGDVMLDRYWFGEVSRISPEAPVPVVKVERTEERPGGAANVARNCAALGARVVLLSVVGTDDAGRSLARLMGE